MQLLETMAVGPLQCNCSILACPDTREAVVVDPGGDAARILEILRHYDLTLRAIVHTHAHLDHILATREVKEAAGGEIGLHRDDKFLYYGAQMQAAMFGWKVEQVLPVDRFLEDGDTVRCGRHGLEVLHTPGHTPGSICFVLDGGESGGQAASPVVFAGDTLFKRSIGRTDLPGGDEVAIARSIRERLYSLPGETRVVCGHGPDTRIGDERTKNPFVQA